MEVMGDLMSNSVVAIGGDRLTDSEAAARLKEYEAYQEKRNQNLIRMPKCADRKYVKGRWKKT